MRRICAILLWSFTMSISQANPSSMNTKINPSTGSIIPVTLHAVDTMLSAGILPSSMYSQFMDLDEEITLDTVPNLVTDNDDERYSCSMSSGFLSRMASQNTDSFGHFENLDTLWEETKSNDWQEVEFQVFGTDHYIIWHEGLKITFYGNGHSEVYALDWGVNDTNNRLYGNLTLPGILTLYSLQDHEVKLYDKCNTNMYGVKIAIESDLVRSKLQTIMLEIREFTKRHTYNVLNDNPGYHAMNCRGFSRWVWQQLEKAEFDNVTDIVQNAKHDMEYMNWLEKLLAMTFMASGSGSSAASSGTASSAMPSSGPHSGSAIKSATFV